MSITECPNRRPSIIGRLCTTLTVLAAVSLLSACGPAPSSSQAAPGPKNDKGVQPSDKASPAKDDKPASDDSTPTIQAVKLSEDFEKDKGAAEKKYQDKRFIIEGEASEDAKNPGMGLGVKVLLHGYKEQDKDQEAEVECDFSAVSPAASDAAKIKKGQKVKIEGQITIAFKKLVRATDCKSVVIE